MKNIHAGDFSDWKLPQWPGIFFCSAAFQRWRRRKPPNKRPPGKKKKAEEDVFPPMKT